MTIDGFLGFLGLVVAIYALLSVVSRYRVRLHGLLLWLPTLFALITIVYLLLFDLLAPTCSASWCSGFELDEELGLTPSKLAFAVVLGWLAYIAGLSSRKRVAKRQLPLLASLVDRLVAERRFPELVDFLEPQIPLVARCASRQLPLQKLRDRVRWHGTPFHPRQPPVAPTRWQSLKSQLETRFYSWMKPLFTRLPESSRQQEAAQQILRFLHTNERLVEFVALERPLFALRLMNTGTYDFDFSDQAFGIMMAHPQSQLRRETLLNQNTGLCFYEIDPQNPLIHALFAHTKVAEQLEVYRPIGDYPLRLLRQNLENYRQTISASKPPEDKLLHRDPTYATIRFFDIMIRSAMRDGIEWHMWLFYLDITVEKLMKSMDRTHPDYDGNAEFPNLGYYLIYEIFDAYGDWLRAIECCPEHSPAVRIESTAPIHENGSILKSAILGIGNSLRHLIKNDAEEAFVTYIIGMLMRNYRDLENRANGGTRAQEALRNSILSGGYYGIEQIHLANMLDCYAGIDPVLQFETTSFSDELQAALQ